MKITFLKMIMPIVLFCGLYLTWTRLAEEPRISEMNRKTTSIPRTNKTARDSIRFAEKRSRQAAAMDQEEQVSGVRRSDSRPHHITENSVRMNPSTLASPSHKRQVGGSKPGSGLQPREAPLPLSFSISEAELAKFNPREKDFIFGMQESFAESMAAAPSQDITSPEYSSFWNRSVLAYDEYLRLTLGWDRFNQLSALAATNHSASKMEVGNQAK